MIVNQDDIALGRDPSLQLPGLDTHPGYSDAAKTQGDHADNVLLENIPVLFSTVRGVGPSSYGG